MGRASKYPDELRERAVRMVAELRPLTRLTEPLEAAVAGLHHGDDVRFRRAGRQAAAIVLQHCADTGQS